LERQAGLPLFLSRHLHDLGNAGARPGGFDECARLADDHPADDDGLEWVPIA
jgi:hypothetical protein